MEILEAVRAAIKELVLPELDGMKAQLTEVRARIEAQGEAIRTLNAHLLDQSRRIDVLGERVDALSDRIDALRGEFSERLEAVRGELTQRFDTLSSRLDTFGARIDALRAELSQRLDVTNQRIDRLYEVVVRRDEHDQLARRVAALEQDVGRIKERLGVP